jgi:hypothetical protein
VGDGADGGSGYGDDDLVFMGTGEKEIGF